MAALATAPWTLFYLSSIINEGRSCTQWKFFFNNVCGNGAYYKRLIRRQLQHLCGVKTMHASTFLIIYNKSSGATVLTIFFSHIFSSFLRYHTWSKAHNVSYMSLVCRNMLQHSMIILKNLSSKQQKF